MKPSPTIRTPQTTLQINPLVLVNKPTIRTHCPESSTKLQLGIELFLFDRVGKDGPGSGNRSKSFGAERVGVGNRVEDFREGFESGVDEGNVGFVTGEVEDGVEVGGGEDGDDGEDAGRVWVVRVGCLGLEGVGFGDGEVAVEEEV